MRQNMTKPTNLTGLSLTPKLPELSGEVQTVCFPFTRNSLFNAK